MAFFDEVSCLVRIREHTCDEYLAVGTQSGQSGGVGREVLRWHETGQNDQLWLVLPRGENAKGETEIRLMSAVDNAIPAPQFLTVFPLGNPVPFTVCPIPSHPLPSPWDEMTPGEMTPEAFQKSFQTFRLMNGNGNTYNIQEPTKNEYAGISGMGGRLIRWVRTGEPDQLFTFEPWEPPEQPPLQKPEAEPGQIGDVPRVTDKDEEPPERSTPKLIGEIAVPSVLVHDGHFSDQLIQFQQSPYYILRREQYWDRTGDKGYYHKHSEGEQWTEEIRVVYRVTTDITETEEQTFGIEFSITGGVSFMGITSSFSSKVLDTLKTTKIAHESIVKEDEKTVTVEYKSEVKSCVFVCWSLVDKYILTRVVGDVREPMQTWTVTEHNNKKVDCFPPNSVTVDGRAPEDFR
jgi:hypothetical protein